MPWASRCSPGCWASPASGWRSRRCSTWSSGASSSGAAAPPPRGPEHRCRNSVPENQPSVVTKPFGDEVLMNAIRNALERSRTALGREAEMRVLRDAYATLTSREREVMALVVAGRLNKQVGGELGISEITVKAHRGNVMRKIQAGSLADLVKMAASLRLAAARPRNQTAVRGGKANVGMQ